MHLLRPEHFRRKDFHPQICNHAMRLYEKATLEERSLLRVRLRSLGCDLKPDEKAKIDPVALHFLIQAKKIYDKQHGRSYCH